MKIQFTCRCGLPNYNLEDWIAHWKHGKSIDANVKLNHKEYPAWIFPYLCKYSKLRAIYLFLMTKIEILK